jgi:uncharacterized protein (DUF433 family)
MDWRKHIHQDPKVCAGVPVIRGTRILIDAELADLEQGRTIDEVRRSYPAMTVDDVRAVIAYAAEGARRAATRPRRTKKVA